MKRWSHIKVLTWDEVIEKGKEGWELVGVMEKANDNIYMLKRQLPGIKEKITDDQTVKALNKRGYSK